MNSKNDKRSFRSNTGMPGTINSPRRAGKRPAKKNSVVNLMVFIVSALIVIMIAACGLGILYFQSKGNGASIPSTQINVSTIIAGTSIASKIQTKAAAPRATSTMAIVPSVTLAPSFTPIPTNTSFIVSTPGKVPPLIVYPTKVSCCVYCSGNLPQPCGNQCLAKYDLCTVPAGSGCACKK